MWWLFACTPDVRGLYDAERKEALSIASERPRGWDADLRLQIAAPDLEDAVAAALRVAVAQAPPIRIPLPLGMSASLTPKVSVARAKLSASDACEACLAFDTRFDGRAAWSAVGNRGDFPFDVSAEGVLAVEVVDGHHVQARAKKVGAVRVKVGDRDELAIDPSSQIQAWVRERIEEALPPIALVDLDPKTLPVRDLRLRTDGGEVRVEALTDVPGAKPAAPAGKLEKGVRLSISESALVGLARRAAYEQGTVAMEVAADPRALHVDGQSFTMDLRLWRLVGRGWWRDYAVKGSLEIVDGKLQLRPEDVKETARSQGAGLVDPLAALFQNRVLEAISDVIRRNLPASRKEDLGDVQLRAAAQRVVGHDQTLDIEGTLVFSEP